MATYEIYKGENTLDSTVRQYTDIRNGRPLRIDHYTFANGGEEWQIIDFCFCIKRCKTALEVKEFLGHRPKLQGAYEIWFTPVGNTIYKQIFGNRVF